MKIGTSKTYTGATAISFYYRNNTKQEVNSASITPNVRDFVDVLVTGGSAAGAYADVVTELGLVTTTYVPQFELLITLLNDICGFDYSTSALDQANLVEIRFMQVLPNLQTGNNNFNTDDGVKKIVSPLGSSIEFFEGANKVAKNMEVLEDLASSLAKQLCSSYVKPWLPIFDAFGVRLSENPEEIDYLNRTGTEDAEGI